MSDKFFDDGGAIDTADEGTAMAPQAASGDDNSPAVDTTGASPPDEGTAMAPQAAQQSPTSGLLQGAQNTNMGKGVKAIVSYLMGAGAAPPQAIDSAAQQVDPDGQMSADDRNIMAVDKANKDGGPQAAWALVQANRVAYNAKQAFAATALNGIDGKPADINAAAQAATQASQHILDGSSATFKPNQQGGVTVAVKPAQGQPQSYNLSPTQFNQWLQVGGDGQWDKVMENGGTAATLQKIAQGQGTPLKAQQGGQGAPTSANPGVPKPLNMMQQPQAPQAPQAPAAPQPGAGAQDDDDDDNTSQSAAPAGPAPTTSFGKTPSTMNLSGTDAPLTGAPPATNYGDELEARSQRIFPGVTQEAQRQQWMAAQESEEANRQNKVDVAGETGKQRIKVAEATGTGRVQAAQVTGQSRVEAQGVRTKGNVDVATMQNTSRMEALKQKALQFAQKQEQSATDSAARDRARNFRAMITNPNFVLQKPEDLQAAAQKAGIQLGAQPAPQGQAQQAPPQGNPQQPPVQGAKLYKGQWYTRGPNGESVPYQQ